MKLNNISFLFIFYFFLCFNLEAQKVYEYDYIGNLTISDTILLTYRIKFDIDKDKIIGYSFTDIAGADETKSKIIGMYDSKNKKITFTESEILYTKSIYEKENFCFIKAEGKLRFNKKKSTIKGIFFGELDNGDKCAKGTFFLMSLQGIQERMLKLVNKVKKSKRIDEKMKNDFYKKVNIIDELKPNTLKANENLSLFWKSKTVDIELWDNKKEDNDKISIQLNGEFVLKNYALKNKKKILSLPLKKGKNIIIINALNEGYASPNTATINLIDTSYKVINITTELKMNDSTTIIIFVE